MGLDLVEIVMEIEDEFQISIPDDVAQNMLTVGDTFRDVVDMLVAKGSAHTPELEAHVWRRLVVIVSEQMQMDPEEIKPESRWIPDITDTG
jgi:hypothetical protein